jgi:hypothetical protein
MEKENIKKILIFVAVIAVIGLVSLVFSYTWGAHSGIAVKGTVKHDNYDSYMGSWYSSISMDEYVVTIDVINLGWTTEYDKVLVYYDAGKGEGLGTPRFALDENDQVQKIVLWPLVGTDQIHSNTNGYTLDILRKREGRTGKIALHLIFYNEGEPVEDFYAVLPSLFYKADGSLPDLPLWEERSIRFTHDYDAVMAEVRGY